MGHSQQPILRKIDDAIKATQHGFHESAPGAPVRTQSVHSALQISIGYPGPPAVKGVSVGHFRHEQFNSAVEFEGSKEGGG